MAKLQLISHVLCPYVQRVAISLHEKGIDFSRTTIDLSNKPEWFLSLSPLGKTPVLVVDGTPIFESAVICEYLEDSYKPALHPDHPLRRAVHRSLIEFGSTVLNAIGSFYSAPDSHAMNEAALLINSKLRYIEQQIDDGAIFCGHHFNLVDAVFSTVFRYFDVFDQLGDFGLYAGLSKVPLWRATLSTRPSVQQAVDANYEKYLLVFIKNKGQALSTFVTSDVLE